MSKFNLTRWSLLGSAAVLAMAGAFTAAKAYETQFGDVSIVFDTTVSMGASMRTAQRNMNFVSESNGGPVDPRSGVADSLVIPAGAGAAFAADLSSQTSFAGGTTGIMRWTNNADNFDGSVNADDARLNFNNGELIGANVKANHDLQMSWENYKVFVRAVGFYDAVLDDKHAGDRSQFTDKALGAVGRNYELLDAFVSADYTLADMPVNLRVGKQVINWGESTFILGGNNVFNPIDVGAFRRPGSEIKEALLPVNAVSASVTLPFQVSVSGYYALDWEPYRLDASGTPFSTSDVVQSGTGQGGNAGLVSFLSGSPFSGARRVCDLGAADGNTALPTIYHIGLLPNPTSTNVGLFGTPATGIGNGYVDCLDNALINKATPYPTGQYEATKLGLISTLSGEGVTRIAQGVVTRDDDHLASNTGDFGLSARWLSEDLGGTEFGFYYQNYSSRLPFASENARTMELGIAAGTHSTQTAGAAGRFATPTGCLADAGVVGGGAAPGDFLDPRLGGYDGVTATTANNPGILKDVKIADPQNLLNAVSLGTAFGLVTGANGGIPYNSAAPGVGLKNLYNAEVLNCALAILQSAGSNVLGGRPALFDGSETLAFSSDIGLSIEYPESIDVWGTSFNTTVGTWGLQGDFTYRPRAPFQVDTDSVTIAAASEQCAFVGVGDLMSTFEPLGTYKGHNCLSGGTIGNQFITGVMYNEMFTAQVGTTATFTASEPWVDALGADLGILVTEAGMVYVPGVEDTWVDKTGTSNLQQQYQNIGCQGSDLPLGGLLGLDHKSSRQCRPTDTSAGLVALFNLQYNDAFGTGFVVTPQIAYSWDFVGTTPAPYGNYMQDRQSVNLGVSGQLNNNFKVGANYTNFFGGHIQNKSTDTDFASLSASYSF